MTYELAVRPERWWIAAIDALSASPGGPPVRLCARMGSGPWRSLRSYPDATEARWGLERVGSWLAAQREVPSWPELRAAARRPDRTDRADVPVSG